MCGQTLDDVGVEPMGEDNGNGSPSMAGVLIPRHNTCLSHSLSLSLF